MENKYQNGKIYKIISPSHPELVYYGSTIKKLNKRFNAHKYDFKKGKNTSSKQIVCFDDAEIILVEKYPCNNKNELCIKEGEYIKNKKCINKNIEGRNEKEIKQYRKAYYKKYYIEKQKLKPQQ